MPVHITFNYPQQALRFAVCTKHLKLEIIFFEP